MKEKNNTSFFTKLRYKFRFIVMNDSTLEEKISIRLSRLNIISGLTIVGSLLFICFLLLVCYTPLNEYVPGKASSHLHKELIAITLKTDSLEKKLHGNELYLKNINAIVNGEDPIDVFSNNEGLQISSENAISFKTSIQDSLLRIAVEAEDKISVFESGKNKRIDLGNLFFFTPINGIVINSFNSKENHFGIDIVSEEREPIKSIFDGVIVISHWTSETGYVIGVQHVNGFFSLYKHNSTLYKKVGEYVKSGEVIAVIGDSGKLSTGPHLHFELWYEGSPVNPEEYINF